MIIDKVTIKNFRSIDSAVFNANDLNIFVGKNDVGKSNFLKALNLFFNDETEIGNKFNFDVDYCLFAKTRSKQAKQIEIEILFNLPETYQEKRKVIWRRVWRREDSDPISDSIVYEDGVEIQKRARVITWLQRIRYRYIPAVKSGEYFSSLLRSIYDVLAKTVENDVRRASENFLGTIDLHTSNITLDVHKKLALESSIRLPTNLGGLFESLDFQTQRNGKPISLQHRGDGIKIRYIPIILEFLAIQENKNRTKGSIKIDTVWGYEEPENNLELINAFKLAEEFPVYSKNIQIFLTTHSPAFYALSKQDNVSLYSIISQDNVSQINLTSSDVVDLDQDVGILPIITPYIDKHLKENKESKEKEAELEKKIATLIEKENRPILFVEGPTDVKIINKVIEIFDLKIDIKVESQVGAGHEWVKDHLTAWLMTKKHSKPNGLKIGGLFDFDNDAKKSKSEVDKLIPIFNKNSIEIAESKNAKVKDPEKKMYPNKAKTFVLKPPIHLRGIFQEGLHIAVTLEEMYHPVIWEFANKNGWLERRTDLPYTQLKDCVEKNITFETFCREKLSDENEILCVIYKVMNEHKEDLANHIINLEIEEIKKALYGFKELALELEAHFQ